MTRMTRPDCAVMCNLINIHTCMYVCMYVCMSVYVCMYVCIFIKLHITAQSGLVILVHKAGLRGYVQFNKYTYIRIIDPPSGGSMRVA